MTETVLDRMTDADRPVAERLWQLYQHDMSEFRGSFPSPEGLFKAGRLPTFFSDPERCGYLLRSSSGPAGFVYVRGVHTEPRVMGELCG